MENLPDRVTAGPYRHWALSPVNSSASYGQNLTCDDLSAVFLADLSASSLADLSASSLAEAVFHCTPQTASPSSFLPSSFDLGSVKRR
jgi:hypothetical protein